MGFAIASLQEKAQGKSNESTPVAKTGECSDSAPVEGAEAPMLLARGGGTQTPVKAPATGPKPQLPKIPQPPGKPPGFLDNVVKGAKKFTPFVKGAGKALIKGGGALGGLILEGIFAEPVGGEKEIEWDRKNRERQRQKTKASSAEGGEKKAEGGDEKKAEGGEKKADGTKKPKRKKPKPENEDNGSYSTPKERSRGKQRKPGSLGTHKGRDALRRENDVPARVAKELKLTKSQQERLHREISGQGYSYEEILQTAKDLFGK